MRNAYALLGLSFLIVFSGAYVLYNKAHAPTEVPNLSQGELPSNDFAMELTSSVFTNGGMIPTKFTCDGENISPPLTLSAVPEGTKSVVLLMDDPDIPQEIKEARGIEKFNHWVLYGLPPDTTEIPEGFSSGISGKNGSGEEGYVGPCPPTQYEPKEHRYIFRAYALPGPLTFITTPTLEEVEFAATNIALAKAELVGRYRRPE